MKNLSIPLVLILRILGVYILQLYHVRLSSTRVGHFCVQIMPIVFLKSIKRSVYSISYVERSRQPERPVTQTWLQIWSLRSKYVKTQLRFQVNSDLQLTLGFREGVLKRLPGSSKSNIRAISVLPTPPPKKKKISH